MGHTPGADTFLRSLAKRQYDYYDECDGSSCPGLAIGSIVGIVVAIVIVKVIIIASCIILCRRRERQRRLARQANPLYSTPGYHAGSPPPLGAYPAPAGHGPAEYYEGASRDASGKVPPHYELSQQVSHVTPA